MSGKAYFGMACFWGAEARFGGEPGVVRTRVGYCGGSHPRPNYPRLYDHTETVEVEYDPSATSYDNLLEAFWEAHDPTQNKKRQYMSVIFYTNPAQQELAKRSKALKQTETDKEIVTTILLLNVFHQAESYHQKYLLRTYHADFLRQLHIPLDDLTYSQAACRLNAHLAGFGCPQSLASEGLGLTPQQMEYVRLHRKLDRKEVVPLIKTVFTVGCCYIRNALSPRGEDQLPQSDG